MKKFFMLVMAILMVSTLFVSCKKDSSSSPKVEEKKFGEIVVIPQSAVSLLEAPISEIQRTAVLDQVNTVLSQYAAEEYPVKTEYPQDIRFSHKAPIGSALPDRIDAGNVLIEILSSKGIYPVSAYVVLGESYVLRVDMVGDFLPESATIVADNALFLDGLGTKTSVQAVVDTGGVFEALVSDRVLATASFHQLVLPNISPSLEGTVAWQKADGLLTVYLEDVGSYYYEIATVGFATLVHFQPSEDAGDDGAGSDSLPSAPPASESTNQETSVRMATPLQSAEINDLGTTMLTCLQDALAKEGLPA